MATITPNGLVSFCSFAPRKKQMLSVSLPPLAALIQMKKRILVVRATSDDGGPKISKLGEISRRFRKAVTDLKAIREVKTVHEKNLVDLMNLYGRIMQREQELMVELDSATSDLNELEKIILPDE